MSPDRDLDLSGAPRLLRARDRLDVAGRGQPHHPRSPRPRRSAPRTSGSCGGTRRRCRSPTAWWNAPMMWPMAGRDGALGASRRPEPRRDAAAAGRARARSPPTTSASSSRIALSGFFAYPPRPAAHGIDARRRSARASRSGSRRTARASWRTFRSCRRSGCRSRSSACTRTSSDRRATLARGLRRRVAAAGAVERLLPAVLPGPDRRCGWRGSSTGAARRAAGWRSSARGASPRCRCCRCC